MHRTNSDGLLVFEDYVYLHYWDGSDDWDYGDSKRSVKE
jgi:hypothetical protein